MKKTILQIGIFAASAIMPITYANAQEGFQLGVQGTPHFSWLINKDDRDNKNFEYINTLSGSFGISGQYGFTKNIGIGLDALYSLQGQRYKLSGIERFKKVDYVKIPVMFIYNYEASKNLMFFYKIGPQVGILTNAKLTDKDGNNIISDQKQAYENADFGAVASAGVGIKLMNNCFLDLALRYDYGFTDAEDKDYKRNINNPGEGASGESYSSIRSTTYNSTAGLTVGIRYLFKTKMKK